MILPTSYTPLASLLNIGPYPIVSRGLGDVYEGTLDGSRVSVKRFRVYSKEGPMKVIKVHHQRNHPLVPLLTSLTDPLPGGCGVETLETSKHRPLPRDHFHSSTAYFRMDAQR